MATSSELVIVQPTVLGAVHKAEIESQIATAKQYPRDVPKALAKAATLATVSPQTAEECSYAMPRGGKTVMGPSVRMAEIIASTWGNLRIATRILDIGEREITVQGVCHDLESNVAESVEVRRRIVDRNGNRYNDDMLQQTANAASAVAYRNACFKVIPKAVWLGVYEKAVLAAQGSGGSRPIADRRKAALTYFASQGIPESAVLKRLGRAKVDDISLDDLQILTGFRNAISQEDAQAQDLFYVEPEVEPEPVETATSPMPTPVKVPEPSEAEVETNKWLDQAIPSPAQEAVADEQQITIEGATFNSADLWADWEKNYAPRLTNEQIAQIREKSGLGRFGPKSKPGSLMKIMEVADEILGA